jgi:hypothetical protein
MDTRSISLAKLRQVPRQFSWASIMSSATLSVRQSLDVAPSQIRR